MSAFESLDPSLRELVELFAGPLASVTFPGVDGHQLTALAAQVAADTAELHNLETSAATLRHRLAETRDDLLHRAHRALAYARVYADGEGAPELAERLIAMTLPRARTQRLSPAAAPTSTASTAKKRGRPAREPNANPMFPMPGPVSIVVPELVP